MSFLIHYILLVNRASNGIYEEIVYKKAQLEDLYKNLDTLYI